MKFEIKGSNFYRDDKKINIYSGAIHYFRILPEYWEDRLIKLREAGFNTVETYIPWNLHEPEKGKFDFTYNLDLTRFLDIATELGLMIILRPSPYICAEFDFGGLPYWLLKDKDLEVRCYDKKYLRAVDDYYDVLLPKIVPYLCTNGGNVIAVQVENEYGSYSNDKKYLNYLKKSLINRNIDCLLFTSDGNAKSMISGGTIKDTLAVMNFGSNAFHAFDEIRSQRPNTPLMCGEFWIGWFTQYGVDKPNREISSITKEIEDFFKLDASFNVYMFSGGTNFGFTAGANYYDKYYATTTSYDYDALISEDGTCTPLYYAVKKLMLEHQKINDNQIVRKTNFQSFEPIKPSKIAMLYENINNIGEKHKSVYPKYMEDYNQGYGYIVYECKIKDAYQATKLLIEDVHDIAYIYINDELITKFDYTKKDGPFSVDLKPIKKNSKLRILVEAMGRINYGHKLIDRKGISKVILDEQALSDFTVYTLKMNNLDNLVFKDITNTQVNYPCFIKYNFKANKKDECYIDIKGLTKGFITINGFNLGRYYNITPQTSLYLPGVLLKEDNELIIFEQEKINDFDLKINDHK